MLSINLFRIFLLFDNMTLSYASWKPTRFPNCNQSPTKIVICASYVAEHSLTKGQRQIRGKNRVSLDSHLLAPRTLTSKHFRKP